MRVDLSLADMQALRSHASHYGTLEAWSQVAMDFMTQLEKHTRVTAALGALTNPDGELVGVHPGPERDELQVAYREATTP